MPLILPGNVASATAAGYDVDNSCRFDEGSADTQLIRTNGSPTNANKGTFSAWIKRSAIEDTRLFQNMVDGNNYGWLAFNSSHQLEVVCRVSGSAYCDYKTNRLFRDISAWYHVMVEMDTTEGTDTNRMKFYVNGVQETSFNTQTFSGNQNSDHPLLIASTTDYHAIGASEANTLNLSGYMAEVVLLDGQALTPTSFGEFDSNSPTIWKPIDVSELTFGNNGYYLDFEDSADLGADVSGNSNDFTEVNLAAADQATDTPTNNFCTLLPDSTWDVGNKSAFSEGNCYASSVQGGHGVCYGTIGASSGKWYFEAKLISQNMHGNSNNLGVITGILGEAISEIDIGTHATGYVWNGQGDIGNNGSTLSWGSLDSESVNDILQCAYDLDNNKLYYGVNGTWDNSSDPAANSNGQAITAAASTPLGMYLPAYMDKSSIRSYVYAYNFGGCPAFTVASGNADADGYGNFEYAVPSGFYALCTKNLAEYG